MREYVGLTNEEVLKNKELYGLNREYDKEQKLFIKSLSILFIEPAIYLLLIKLLIQIFIKNYIYIAIISIFLLIIIIIHLVFIIKYNKKVNKIKKLQSFSSKVIRDGKLQTIDSNEITINDILVLNKGDRVCADAIILESKNLLVYEANITKNNNFVNKSVDITNRNEKYKSNRLYSGSFIIKGNCFARVTEIGKHTEIYKQNNINKDKNKSVIITKAKKINNIFYILSIILFIILTIIFTFKMNFISSIINAFILASDVIIYPFGFVSIILYPFSIYKLIDNNILIKNLDLINKLNKVSCLCIDKTGIITQGKMKITNIKTDIDKDELIEHALLSSSLTPIDIIEKSIHEYSNYINTNIRDGKELIKKYPFNKDIKMSANIYRENDENYIYVKGSLESIFDVCDISVQEKFNLFKCKDDMINSGLKVVAVGSSKIDEIKEDILDYNIKFEALIGIYDEPRVNINKYISYCKDNNIRVLIFTDDNKEISSHIARTIELDNPDNVLNSDEINDNEIFTNNIDETNLFSQITTKDKQKIIKYLKDNNEIVAVTSSNIEEISLMDKTIIGMCFNNDSDINKSMAQIIYFDNSFKTIVNNIKVVRYLHSLYKKFRKFILLMNIPIIILTIILSFFNLNFIVISLSIIMIRLIILTVCCVKFNK